MPFGSRCCNSGEGGSTRCMYTGRDRAGKMIGTCCVGNDKPGCLIDSDCCQEDQLCVDGTCTRRHKYEGSQMVRSMPIFASGIESAGVDRVSDSQEGQKMANGMHNENLAAQDRPVGRVNFGFIMVAIFVGVVSILITIYFIRKWLCGRGGRRRNKQRMGSNDTDIDVELSDI